MAMCDGIIGGMYHKLVNNAMPTKTSREKLLRRIAHGAIIVTIGISLSACTAGRIATRGNLPDPERVAELKPGEVNKDDVLDALGSPSSINIFGKETWYYISEKTETLAFFKPEVLERKVMIVEFNKKAKLAQIVSVGLDAGREVTLVKRITPTFGEKLTVLDQLLGNLRRFSGQNKPKAQQ